MTYKPTVPRGPVAAMYASPGPCYPLPGLCGHGAHDPRSGFNKGPAYSLSYRHGKYVDDCSPGPVYLPAACMTRSGRSGEPSYSLYSRPRDVSAFKTPGPGSYSPEKVGPQAYMSMPKYSFGIRFKARKSDNSPGPNSYILPAVVGSRTYESQVMQAPVHSIRGRRVQGSFCEDLGKTPGPGTYKVVNPNQFTNRTPSYSMTSRNLLPGDGTQKPGPGAHSPEKVYINKHQAPICSFGIRHSPYIAPLIVDVRD